MCKQSDGDSWLGMGLLIAGIAASAYGSYHTAGPDVTAIWVGFLIAWLGWKVL